MAYSVCCTQFCPTSKINVNKCLQIKKYFDYICLHKNKETMNTTKDLLKAFGKGSDYFRMTAKQGAWFLSLAKKEKAILDDFGDCWYVLIDGKKYRVGKTYIPMSCYGGGIGKKKLSGNYNVEPA